MNTRFWHTVGSFNCAQDNNFSVDAFVTLISELAHQLA